MDANLKESVGKVVAAGLTVLYAPQMKDMLTKGLMQQAPVPQKLAEEIGGLMRMLDDKAGGKIPKQAMIPAAMILLQDLASFLQNVTGQKVTDEELMQAMKLCADVIIQEYQDGAQAGPAAPSAPAAQQEQAPRGLLAQGA